MLNQVQLGIFKKFLFHLRAKLYFGMVQSLLLTLKYSNLYKSVYKKESPDKSLNCLSKRFFYNDAICENALRIVFPFVFQDTSMTARQN